MLLRMALFFLNYPVRISQKSCRATDALRDSGLSTQDFAGLVKCSGLNDAHSKYTDEYSLRYAEFISLNTYMIQRLYRRIDELEQKLQAIEA